MWLVVKNPPANAGDTSVQGFDPWVRRSPLEHEMATHSSILAWEISCTEEPGGLQSTGLQSQTHTHTQTDHTHTHTHTHTHSFILS